jgi:hypothetical protein
MSQQHGASSVIMMHPAAVEDSAILAMGDYDSLRRSSNKSCTHKNKILKMSRSTAGKQYM